MVSGGFGLAQSASEVDGGIVSAAVRPSADPANPRTPGAGAGRAASDVTVT